MTYRDVFSQANPHAVHEALGWTEVEWDGELVRFRSERAFEVCKGLRLFADGYKYEVDEATEKEQIRRRNPNPHLSAIHVQVIYNSLRSKAGAAIEALGIIGESNIDSQVQAWLDQDVSEHKDTKADEIAITILTELLKDKLFQHN